MMDDQRDYAEEAYNRAEYHKEQEAEYLAEQEEKLKRELLRNAGKHFWSVASSPDSDISWYKSPEYQNAKTWLLVLIARYYPQLCASDVYEIFIDSGENVAYAASYLKAHGSRYYGEKCEMNIGCCICTVRP